MTGPRDLQPLKNVYRYARRVAKSTLGKDHLIRRDVSIPNVRLGNDWADWVIAEHLLLKNSIVYSVGIGEDISFDVALMQRYGCQVFGWDPTPLAIDYIASHLTPPGFTLLPYGLSSEDGVKQFGGKSVGDHSYSSQSLNPAKISLEVRRLTSLMRLQQHDHIDLLKMDIEGDEYDVIREIVDQHLIIPQLLIEFHHGWYRIPVEKTREHVNLLRQAGYRIFDVSPVGREISFIHLSALRAAA